MIMDYRAAEVDIIFDDTLSLSLSKDYLACSILFERYHSTAATVRRSGLVHILSTVSFNLFENWTLIPTVFVSLAGPLGYIHG